MKFITQIARFFVGFLFIISGLIKLNDPVGFSFKLDEYFSDAVFNMPFLQPLALSIAVFVVIVEVILGVLLLIGFKKKFTLWSLFLMIFFFTFLTFYSAYFNKVTDCGCFGDALKLTPWQSFSKDVVLLVLILILFAGQKYIQPIFKSNATNYALSVISLALCSYFGYHVLNHLPVVDFRAYKVGTNIRKGMEIPEGAPESKYDIIFKYNVNGVATDFKMDELVNLPEGAEFISREEILLVKGYEPPIHDFSIEKDGENFMDQFLEEPKLLMFVSYNLNLASEEGLAALNKISIEAKEKGYQVIALTASNEETIADFVDKYNFDFDFYFCDATTLKTIERANPSLVVLEYGTIVQKLHWQDAAKISLK